ncbi:MAG TPA: serine/threonine-protein kinase, partial [Ktedonobacteraceae bacterium]|nr:serine/threonine-protein kinase [Ktedonobacteraceae bacterium]
MNDSVGQPPQGAQQLGNYRLTRLLGQGGFADVYLGEHIHLRTQAAIKILQMRLAEEHAEAFINEARTIAHLVHPNIVRVLDFGVQNGVPFLVMDYAPGGTLRQRMPSGRPNPASALFPFLAQVASALQYAHNRKLIHRDIKPENMLIGVNGEVLLSDFGLALVTHSTGSRSTVPGGDMAGTATYMAPEQVQGNPRSASDQYALAVVVYEWLTGTRPFQGTFLEVATQQVLAPIPSLRAKIPTLPLPLEEVVMRAMAKDPQQRFPSILDFAAALEQACLREGIISAQQAQTSLSILSKQTASGTSPSGTASQLTFLASVKDQDAQSAFAAAPTNVSARSQFAETSASQDFQTQETAIDPQESQVTFIKTPQTFAPVTPTPGQRTPIGRPLTQTADNSSDEVVKALKRATRTNRLLIIVSVVLVSLLLISGTGVWLFTRPNRRIDQPGFDNPAANPYAPHTGKLALNDPLDGNHHGWDEGNICNFRAGSYHISLPMNRFATCYAHATDYRNFTYEVQMTFLKMGHTSSAAGIAFRGDNTIPAAYVIQIFQRGKYSFLACSSTCQVVSGYPAQPQIIPSFHTQPGQSNTLAVVAHDDSFTFYVNGQ